MTRRIVYVVTHPITARSFLRGQLAYMARRGFDVTLVASPGPDLDAMAKHEGISTVAVPMRREVHVLEDLAALARLVRLLRRLRPVLLNASTPKAGLLGSLAGWLASVPVRIYTLRGLRLETTTGLKRALLVLAERTAHACAHRVVCASPSLLEAYRRVLALDGRKLTVLGPGNGIDLRRLELDPERRAAAAALRHAWGWDPGAPILGFVGRMTRDKGIPDLVEAFRSLRATHPDLRLLLVGDTEAGDPLGTALRATLREHPAVRVTGFVDDPVPYYALMDVLALPSYREGLPNAILEASALGIPVVGYDATGTRDAIVDGRTGALVPPGDTQALVYALSRYLRDRALAKEHGEAGRSRVESEFVQVDVWRRVAAEYDRLLRAAQVPDDG